jgi:hypothetical protein
MTRPLDRRSAWLAAVVVCALAIAMPAAAQARRPPARSPRPPRTPRVELGFGAGVAGGLTLGQRDATLLSNNATGSPFRLFSTDTRVAPAALVEGRVGYRVTSRLTVEGLLTVGRPDLISSLSADAENATAVEATSRLTEYVITGGAIWRLTTNPRRRWTPFVSGGAGVARHVHEGQTLIESGVDGYVGGGLIYPAGSRRAGVSRAGLRVDARLHMLNGGVAEGAGVSPRGVVTGSVFVTF